MDRAWWVKYYADAAKTFAGDLVTICSYGKKTKQVRGNYGLNSGAGALCFAVNSGAARVILLGYDCSYAQDGKRHWHGDHPAGLGNCGSIKKFPRQFADICATLGSAEIVNASRSTALDVWPVVDLDAALGGEAWQN